MAFSPVDSATPTRVKRSAWIVLGLATLSAGLTGPGQTIGVSVFVDRFIEDLSLSRDQVSAAYLVGTLSGAALLPWVGRQIDRRGVRIAQMIIGALFALALVNMSLVNGIVWLAVGFAGIRFLGQGSLTLVSTVTVSLAFPRRRGTALGIFATATSGLMALVPVGLSFAIDGFGWRQAWLVSAAIVATAVVPIAFFGYRGMPRGTDAKNRADSDGSGSTQALFDDGSSASDFERGEAMRTRSFWMIAAVSGSTGMLSTALNFHQIDLMGESGISETAAAALFLPQVIGSTIAGLVVGFLADRLGLRYLPAAGMALLIAAHLLGSIITPGAVVIVYSIVLGATGGAVRTASATLLPGWFGTSHLGSIQGALTFFNVAASAIGPVVLSIAQGAFGDYSPAILVLAVIPAAALVFSLLDDPKRRAL
ncbi:MAG: MFS family permease [Ilumatobacter sp.]